jgi:PAS domain S-box-containing protein
MEPETELGEAAVYLDAMGDALVVLDGQRNIVKINKAAMELWGYDSKEEPIGQSMADFLPERTLPRHYAEMEKAVETNSIRPFECLVLAKDGTEIPVMFTGTVMKDAGGRVLGFVGVFRDISQRKRLEQSLADIAKEERERLRRDLHDGIGQQLTGLRLLAESLRRELSATHTGAADRIAQIEQIAGDALVTVRQIAKGLEPLSVEPDALFTALKELASRSNCVYDTSCRFTSRKRVLIQNPDAATHLFLIAQEAVANAARHARPGEITIALSERDSTLRLVIGDDGIGFAPGNQHKGMGIGIMRSRAALIGASLDIGARGGGGTVVACSWKKTPPGGQELG